MSTEVENLHAAIRRYCMDRYSYWTEKYGELVSAGKHRSGYEYTNEALYTFPRYNVLNAILVEVERHRPAEFASLDEAKHAFKAIATNAENLFTKPPKGKLEQQAMGGEREALNNFISKITADDLGSVEPLFYRRVLTAEEVDAIWDKLQTDWGIGRWYWYPLADRKREDTEAFQDSYVENEVGTEKLRTLLSSHGIEKLWEIREDGINYELELSIFEPYYNGNEGYWCDSTFEWVIYASHERSVTIGGWLLDEVKEVWPEWEKRVWITPSFTDDS